MATQPPVLNHQGKKWGNNFFDVIYPIAGLIIILANNWSVPNKQGLQKVENYLNGPKDIDDVMNIGSWILHTSKQILIFLVAYYVCAWAFEHVHDWVFGKKAKPNLIWKAIAYTCFLALVYFFTK